MAEADGLPHPQQCPGGCGFFGPPENGGWCSRCLEEHLKEISAAPGESGPLQLDEPAEHVVQQPARVALQAAEDAQEATSDVGALRGPTVSNQEAHTPPPPPQECIGGCGFFGLPENGGRCSRCLEEHLKEIFARGEPADQAAQQERATNIIQMCKEKFLGRVPDEDLEVLIMKVIHTPELEAPILEELQRACPPIVPETTAQCPVCLESRPVSKTNFFWDEFGGCTHSVCHDCVGGLFDHATSDGEARCPSCSAPIPHVCLQMMDPGRFKELEEALATKMIQKGVGEGFQQCPRCKTPGCMEVHRPPELVTCPVEWCGQRFCSRCAGPRYHFVDCQGRDCREVMKEKEGRWLQWQAAGQAQYLRRMEEQNAEYARQLQVYQGDVQAKQQAFQAFRQDEESKRGWRHCPHCNTVWSGTDACNHVTCGVMERGMGGIRGQQGCGRNFDFATARPYTPQQPPPLEALPPPTRAQEVVHQGIACDKCHNEVVGVRFRCLHCPCYNLCLECLVKEGPGHPDHEDFPGLEGSPPHFFDILYRPEH